MSVEKAIRRLLDGSDARAVRVSATSWRIERRPARVARAASLPQRAPQPRAREPSNDMVAAAQHEIIVTASKTDLPHSHFAGVVTQLDGGDLAFGGERGMDSILSRTASVSSTHLGPGRNKLFIRGIADSSFTGPTQSTVGRGHEVLDRLIDPTDTLIQRQGQQGRCRKPEPFERRDGRTGPAGRLAEAAGEVLGS